MEEEIDLHRYIVVLWQKRYWIAGLTFGAALVALVVSFLLPKTYEATALVVATKPRYVMQFDSRIAPVESVSNVILQPAYKSLPELAVGDEILNELMARLGNVPDVETLQDLKKRTTARSGTDVGIIKLTVRGQDAKEVAHIVNLWAEIFVQSANEIYGTQGESQLQFFRQQLDRARADLDIAEKALAGFQARNREAILQNQLGSYRQMHADYLADQRRIRYLVQDIQALREQLDRRPADRPANLADQLTMLFLQIKSFNAQASAPIQLQVNDTISISTRSVAEQIAFLDDLTQVLEAQSEEIAGRLVELEPQILSLQQQLQELATERDRLSQARTVAQETCLALARKVQEAQIAADDVTSREVRLGSRAAVPDKPVSPRKLINTAIAGMLGLMIGVFGTFAVEWWKSENKSDA